MKLLNWVVWGDSQQLAVPHQATALRDLVEFDKLVWAVRLGGAPGTEDGAWNPDYRVPGEFRVSCRAFTMRSIFSITFRSRGRVPTSDIRGERGSLMAVIWSQRRAQKPAPGEWIAPSVSYVDPTRRFCQFCGRPIARRFWKAETKSGERLFCEPALAALQATYPMSSDRR